MSFARPAASPHSGRRATRPARPPALAPTFLRPGAPRQQRQQQRQEAEAEQRGRLPGPRGERQPRAHHAPRRGQRGRQPEGIAGDGAAGPGRASAPRPPAGRACEPASQRAPPTAPCERPNRFRVRGAARPPAAAGRPRFLPPARPPPAARSWGLAALRGESPRGGGGGGGSVPGAAPPPRGCEGRVGSASRAACSG